MYNRPEAQPIPLRVILWVGLAITLASFTLLNKLDKWYRLKVIEAVRSTPQPWPQDARLAVPFHTPLSSLTAQEHTALPNQTCG